MRNETRLALAAYTAGIAQANGVSSVENSFTVTPTVAQTLERKIQEGSAFLSSINMVMVPEQSGQALKLAVGSPVSGRTNTAVTARQPSVPHDLDGYDYTCVHTDMDTAITYAQLDAWAKFPNFADLVRASVIQQQALDRIMIGWNGTSAAATTNRTTNPLLQDVNIGWVQKVRTNKPGQIVSDAASAGGPAIKISPTGAAGSDYANLDGLVFDLVNNLIAPWFRENPDLRVILGRDLAADVYFPLVNAVQPPTEKIATQIILSGKRIGGLPAVQVPFFPANAIAVTTLKNLSIYTQEGTRRRHIKEEAERSRISNYESVNDAFVVEEYDLLAYAENITFVA